jgi:guanylate kinase
MARAGQNRKKIARRGLMFVLSSPSGAGKTTLSRLLLRADNKVELSVSVTTRPQRRGEVDGRDYHFIDSGPLQAGCDVLFDIDWQGTQQLRERARDDLVSVFILPPTAPELERRLNRRAQDTKAVIASRMSKAAGEMSHWPEYDYVIVNRDKAEAFAEIRAILAAERLKRDRQIGLSDFVRRLQAKL